MSGITPGIPTRRILIQSVSFEVALFLSLENWACKKSGANRRADLWNLTTHAEGPAMVSVVESARALKRSLSQTSLNDFTGMRVTRMVLAIVQHYGRMSCSSAAGEIAAESIHRGQLTQRYQGAMHL